MVGIRFLPRSKDCARPAPFGPGYRTGVRVGLSPSVENVNRQGVDMPQLPAYLRLASHQFLVHFLVYKVVNRNIKDPAPGSSTQSEVMIWYFGVSFPSSFIGSLNL